MIQKLEMIIGTNVRRERRRRGLSQTELARMLGVTFQQVQKYESGRDRIAASRLYAVSRCLALPFDDLLTGLDELPDGMIHDDSATV